MKRFGYIMRKLPFQRNKLAPDGAAAVIEGFTITSEAREKKKTKGKIFKGRFLMILSIVLLMIGVLFFTAQSFGLRTWGGLTMDELIFHLTAPKEGTEGTIIASAVLQVVVPTGAALMGVIVLAVVVRKKNPARYRVVVVLQFFAAAGLISYSVVHFLSETEGFDYIHSQFSSSTFIEDNYADPSTVAMKFPEQKRNLVYIYLESMETTYTDKDNGGGFADDYIPELTQLAQEYEDFSGNSIQLNGGNVLSNTGYTMGAMFAQTSGLPLQTTLYNGMDTQDSFYSGIQTLGDILDEQGYRQVLMVGSEASFGGRELYFSEHGNYEMRDYNWAKETDKIPSNYHVWWGYEDQKLFEYAKETLTELASNGQPFNLTMLTADTHFEDGYICSQCENRFNGNQYGNVIACSSRQVVELVTWIRQQDFYENTTIVISGDHTTMDKDFCDSVSDDYTRKTYTCYINSAVQPVAPERRREYATIDNFPTTLAALGVSIDGDQLGLGTNLFSDQETLIEQYGLDMMNEEMQNKSAFLESKNKIVVTDEMIEKIKGYVSVAASENGNDLNTVLTGLEVVDRQKKTVTVSVAPVSEDGNAEAAKSAKADSRPCSDNGDQIYSTTIREAFSSPGTYRIRFHVTGENGMEYDLKDVRIYYSGK